MPYFAVLNKLVGEEAREHRTSDTHRPPPSAAAVRLRLRVTGTAESVLRSGHPWLFADSIQGANRDGAMGDIAAVYDRNDCFLAVGLFDPESPLRLRVLNAGKPVRIDRAWWQSRLRTAIARRQGVFDDRTTGYRWIHGESDGWPGLVLDRYDTTLVLKLYTAAWLPHWSEILSVIREELNPERLVLRLSRNIQETARRSFGFAEGQICFGPPLSGPVTFLETGLRFEADVVRGQKTGFFLDQRENRRKVEALAAGRDVLNVFSFSGGFSLYSARGGARSVLDVDMSPHALAAADRNFALNQALPAVGTCRYESVQADAFKWLEAAAAEFDLAVLDPPSLARRKSERLGALRAYQRLLKHTIRLIRPGGLLLASSCSAHISREEFFKLAREAACVTGRAFTELATTLHPPDHPASFAESEYLKAIYLRFT